MGHGGGWNVICVVVRDLCQGRQMPQKTKGAPRAGNHLAEPRESLPPHILLDATKARFGYDPRTLKPCSGRLVIVCCISCGGYREKEVRSAVEQRTCLLCANRARAVASSAAASERMKAYYANGGRHGMSGRTHTLEARARITRANTGRKASVATRANISAALRRRDPPSAETRRKLSLAHSGRNNASYGKSPSHAKKVWVFNSAGDAVCMRSTWEAAFADYLTAHGIEWEYEPEAFPVRYVVDGKVKDGTYRPDFRVGNGLWFEVKGRWLVEARSKTHAFLAQHPDEQLHVLRRAWFKERQLLPKRAMVAVGT
jgi:hypothetical protein